MGTSVVSSITRMGTIEPFELQVSRGQITGHRLVMMNGYNTDIDTAWESLWPVGGFINYPAAALQMKVSSSSANDTSAGTGARTVLLSGLDANYAEISEVVTLNGQTAVTTTNSFLRINGFTTATAGSGLANAGDIYVGTGVVTAGVPATPYDVIPAGFNIRQTHAYTIPAGYTGYTVAARFTLAQVSGTSAVWARLTQTGTDGIKKALSVAQLNNGPLVLPIGAPLPIPEKTTIAGEGMGDAVNNYCASFSQLILVANNGQA